MKDDQGNFVVRTTVDEVVLSATVVDHKGRLTNDLDRAAFTVYEDGKPQVITSFHREDVPTSIGIVVDNSGSMREKRDTVNQAALNLVRAGNPTDEIFVVNFNDGYYLDLPLTNNLIDIEQALNRYETRGGTALYDAVVASTKYLKQSAGSHKKALFVVTDGVDNASRVTLQKTLSVVSEEDGPTIYTVGLFADEKDPDARHALEMLATKTGGISFFPRSLGDLGNISRTVANEIRNQYTIAYKPTNPVSNGRYRTVKVEAHTGNGRKLEVRTRTGYTPEPI